MHRAEFYNGAAQTKLNDKIGLCAFTCRTSEVREEEE